MHACMYACTHAYKIMGIYRVYIEVRHRLQLFYLYFGCASGVSFYD